MFVIIMQKMTSIVQNNCQKKGQQPRSPGHGQGCVAGFGRARQMVEHFTHLGKKVKKVGTTVYRLKPYKNSKNTTEWMRSAIRTF